jgi:hypothetical protein
MKLKKIKSWDLSGLDSSGVWTWLTDHSLDLIRRPSKDSCCSVKHSPAAVNPKGTLVSDHTIEKRAVKKGNS